MQAKDTETIASPPPGRVRAIISVFIVVYFVWQLALPITYYLGDDVNDERFSWRMFSAIWHFHHTCTVSVMEIESVLVPGPGNTPLVRQLDLDRTVHQAWITLLNRNQPLVVEKFLQTRCQSDQRVAEVQYSRRCPEAGESRIPSVARRLTCGTRVIAGSPGTP